MSRASDKRGAAARSLIVFKSNPARQMREQSTRSRFRLQSCRSLIAVQYRLNVRFSFTANLLFQRPMDDTNFHGNNRDSYGRLSRAVCGISHTFAPASLRSLAVLFASSDDDDDNLRRRRIGSQQRSRLLKRLLRGGGSAALSHRSVS